MILFKLMVYEYILNFKLSIYNRWGTLVWEGNNETEDWDGTSTKGTHLLGNNLPDGTYYYILELNDPDYPNPINGFLHLKNSGFLFCFPL